MRGLLMVFLIFPLLASAQVEGVVNEEGTQNPLYAVKVFTETGLATRTNPDGEFILDVKIFPTWIYFSLIDFKSDSVLITKNNNKVKIFLISEAQKIKTLVVSASRRSQRIEDVPISMEVIKADFIEKKGLVNLEQVADQAPGVYAMDGQVSIRGGGGYAYGVGSRVLVLTNGIPLISPDLGDVKWNSVPLESISQVEIIKGASSVLYGSGALNGMISLTPKEPVKDGELKVKYQSGFYGNPKRASLKWWSSNPTINLLNVYYGKMYDQVGFTLSSNGYLSQGYKDGERENRGRLSGSFFYKPTKVENLKIGIRFNGQFEDVGRFIIWESDSLGYTPSGGGSPETNPNSSITIENSIRISVDPYVKYLGKNNSKHELKGRYYLVSLGSPSSLFYASKAEMYYGDYQFSKKWGKLHNLSTGVTSSANIVRSPDTFGNHNSINVAGYAQYDIKMKRFDATAGVRLEYFKQDNLVADSQFDLWKTKNAVPIYPIFRTALHYALTPTTHLRTSFGQGIRFPAVGERFLSAESGGVKIFPNPKVSPEKGWAAEIGVKQIFNIGKWKSMFDVAGFINQYQNMIEFVFGVYNPDDVSLNFDPDDIGYIYNWVGFQASNSEEARITGLEFSFNSEGKIKDVELQSLIGYTYLNPISLSNDPDYLSTFSDTSSGLLKYRFKHLVKLDIQSTYKNFFLGYSLRYNSYMHNIDQIFEADIYGTEILPGLKDYRLADQSGSVVMDARLGCRIKDKYSVSVLVNNFLNTEYSSRPADIQAPRQFLIQLHYGI